VSPVLRRRAKSSRRKRGMHPLVAAALVIFGAVFITFYAFNGGLPFVHRFTLYAIVDNSVNIRTSAPVRIAGIDVGMVQGTSPDGDATKIAFTVNSNGEPIHSDATITIRDRLFLEGNYYLDLFPGSPSAPILKDGATIPTSNTSSPVQFFKLLSVLEANTREDLTNEIGTLDQSFSRRPGQPLSASGAAGLKGAIPQLTPVLKDTAWITGGLQGTQPGDAGRLLRSASEVTTTLARNTASLTGLVDSLNTTATALASTDGALARSVSGLDQTLRVAPPALTAVDLALPPVTNLATALEPSLKLAPPLLDGVIQAVDELDRVVAPVERGRLLRSLKATFEQLPSLLTKLGRLFPVTKAVTDCLRTHVTPILDSIVPDGNFSSGRPVWQDFVHFLPGIVSAAQNFDGNGYWIRLLVGAGTNSFSLGNLPGVGQLVGDTPSNSPIEGSRPIWQGDVTSDAFHPEVPCAQDKLPSLASATASSDARTITAGAAPKPLSLPELRNDLMHAARAGRVSTR
jgi:phospholipid/cholesterol/gamma-HCH transport system substrate-binding protein